MRNALRLCLVNIIALRCQVNEKLRCVRLISRLLCRAVLRADDAVGLMTSWMKAHFDSPYPTSEQRRELAETGGISEQQVTTWFGNVRKRFWKVRSRPHRTPRLAHRQVQRDCALTSQRLPAGTDRHRGGGAAAARAPSHEHRDAGRTTRQATQDVWLPHRRMTVCVTLCVLNFVPGFLYTRMVFSLSAAAAAAVAA